MMMPRMNASENIIRWRIPIVIILWLGDDDLDPEVKIIFDKNITAHLSAEDVVILCNLIAIRLVKMAA